MFGRFASTPGEDDAARFGTGLLAGPCSIIGKIESVAGTCSLIRAGRIIVEIAVGDPVCRGDIVKTAADGRLGIRFIDGTAFSLSNSARMLLSEFAHEETSPSARFDVTRGTFAFIAGEMAKAGQLTINTPVANIIGRTRRGGMGTLTLAGLIFAVMEEAHAESPGDGFLDDGTITYNGVFELVTKEPIPRHFLVDNPLEQFVFFRNGSAITAEVALNSNADMDQLHKAQQDALHIFALGLAQGPTATGSPGSDGSPAPPPPSFFQPINFTLPPDNPPPPGPTGSGPPPGGTLPIFIPIFIPPPAGPGKINETPGQTHNPAVDSTSSTLDLASGPATVGAPAFAWSAGALTSVQQTQLTAASTLTLSDSGGVVGFQYSAEDQNFDFLAAGETLTVTYDVTVGGVTKQAIITITGTEDTPAITSAAQGGAITEEQNASQPNPTGSTDPDKANGAVTFTDVDLSDHHQVTVTGVVASGVTTGLASNAAVLGWLTLGTLTDTTGTGLAGSQPWAFSAQDKNFDYLAAGEKLTLTYTVQVDDHNGGTVSQDVVIVVTGTNDTPSITSAAQGGPITEEQNASQPNPTGSTDLDKANGAVTFTDVDLSDHHQVTVTGVVASGVTTGLASNAAVLGWLTLGTLTDTTGTGLAGSQPWAFSAQDKNFDYLAAGEKLTLTYTVQVDDHNGGTVSQDVVIVVTGTNDTPSITSAAQGGPITEEQNASQPNPTGSTDLDKANGAVTFTDVDLSDHHQVTVTGVVASGVTTGLASNAAVLGWLTLGTLTDTTGTGLAGSQPWAFSAQDKNFDYLAAGEKLTLTYTVQVDDHNGGTVSQDVVIVVTGTNDTPSITSAAQGGPITEEQNASQPNPTGSTDLDKANGAVTFTDVDLSDHHQVTVTGVVASGVTTGLASNAAVLGWLTLGTLTDTTGTGLAGSQPWAFSAQDKNFDYLAAGEKLTLTYTVQVDDHNGGTVSQDVVIVVTGTNDTPSITSAAQGGPITEEQNASQPNPTGSTDLDKANGAVTFTDVDLSDHHQVTVTGVVASGVTTGLASNAAVLGWLTLGTLTDTTGTGLAGSQPWAFSAQDKNFDYLAAGEKLTLTYTVQVDDHNGGTVSQDVVIVVTGTNDTPAIAVVGTDSAAATLTESYKTLSAAGTLTATDVDLSDTVTATVKGVTLGGTKGGLSSADVLGMLSLTTGAIAANPTDAHNLAWSFNSNPQTFSFLDAGESLTLTYTVQVNDGHGGTTNQTVTITVNGTNQPDLITSFTGIDSHSYFGEHTPVTVHVADGGADVTAHATYQWQVLRSGTWNTVSTTNSFSQIETYEGRQLRVVITYAEGGSGGTDKITTYLGQISDNDSDDHGAAVQIQNLPSSLQIVDGTALELAAASALAVFFPTAAGAYGNLVIDHAAGYTGAISNFTGTSTQSDAIDLKDITFDSGLSLAYHDNSGANTGGTLTIRESGHTVDTITFANGDYTTASFTLSSDGHGGTIISDPPTPAASASANTVLTTGIDVVAFDNGAHQVSGTDQTVNHGDTLAGGAGADTLIIDSGNGDHHYTFGDGSHDDIGLTKFDRLALTDANATGDHAVAVTFDSSFHNNGTLTVDGSALTHLSGANLTIDAHLASSDSFVFIGSASADTLIGGSNGNNTITGGGGGDVVTGGGGNNTFVFKAITDSQPGAGHFDTITNFTHNSDHFDFAAISGLNSTVQPVTFNSLTAAPGSLAAHTIDIVTSGGNTVVYANASPVTETLAHVDMEIHLNNVANVHSTDFILHA